MFWVFVVFIGVLAAFELRPNVPKQKANGVKQEPYSQAGTDVPIVFGTCYVRPKILGLELISKQAIYAEGGKK